VCIAETARCACRAAERSCASLDTERRCIAGELVSLACGAGLSCPFDGCREEWLAQFGTPSGDVASALWVDAEGGVVVAGTTRGLLAGTANAGQTDVFVRRYDVRGRALWTTQFGSTERESAIAVRSDELGNVIVTGAIGDPFIDPTAAGEPDAFIAKLDPNGVVLWTRQFGTSDDDSPRGLELDADGNILVAGASAPLGRLDASVSYLIKFDRDGSELWARTIPEFASVMTLELAGTHDILIASVTASAVLDAELVIDVVVMRYDASGERVAERRFAAHLATERSVLIALDVNGEGQATLAGTVANPLPDEGFPFNQDIFVQRYDANGAELWSQTFGTPALETIAALSLDGRGNVWVAGDREDGVPGEGFGRRDIFVTMFDATGASWTRRLGAEGNDTVTAIATHVNGHAFIAGWTDGALPGQIGTSTNDAFVIDVGEMVPP
jgi:hypothetical protein